MPLRVWAVGYAMQCVLHTVCVLVEFDRRRRYIGGVEETGYVTLAQLNVENNSGVAKHLESANTIFSFIWWIIGFYWVSVGGQALATKAPHLYWLCIIFLAFDVFFIFFCIAVACVIGIAVCCCLPCIIAILCAVTDQEGASRENVEQLSKYIFQRSGDIDQLSGEIQGPFAGVMTECGTDTPIEHSVMLEDAECCICLTTYSDGVELRELPCGHHFHCTCVDKWLYINATCPLCKYNIKKTRNSGSGEV